LYILTWLLFNEHLELIDD